jgi:hypothetical protein
MEGITNRIQRIKSYSQSVAKSSLWDGDENIQSVFGRNGKSIKIIFTVAVSSG